MKRTLWILLGLLLTGVLLPFILGGFWTHFKARWAEEVWIASVQNYCKEEGRDFIECACRQTAAWIQPLPPTPFQPGDGLYKVIKQGYGHSDELAWALGRIIAPEVLALRWVHLAGHRHSMLEIQLNETWILADPVTGIGCDPELRFGAQELAEQFYNLPLPSSQFPFLIQLSTHSNEIKKAPFETSGGLFRFLFNQYKRFPSFYHSIWNVTFSPETHFTAM
jgi:hypothetical protein